MPPRPYLSRSGDMVCIFEQRRVGQLKVLARRLVLDRFRGNQHKQHTTGFGSDVFPGLFWAGNMGIRG